MIQFFLYLLILFPLQAPALNITANVDKAEVGLNETFVFTLKIQSDKEQPKHWNIPNIKFNDFHLSGEWSGQESSIYIVNGKTERNNIFSKNYRLQPKTIGTLRIESITLKTHNKTITTDPIFITVHKQSKNKPPSKPQINFPQNPLWNLPTPFHSPNSLFDIFNKPSTLDKSKNSVKFRLNLNKKSVYKSEMIRADWLILQSSGSIRYDIYKNPSLQGFWKEEIRNKNTRSSTGTMIIDDVLYRKTILNSLWLFPLQTGKLNIDPYSVRIRHIFGFRSQEEIKSTSQKQITVKELPIKGKDHRWTGAVGSFKVQASIKDKITTVNQPISYNIHFKGSGHPRFIHLPPIPFPSSVKTYPAVEKLYFSELGIGTKNFEILIVPKQEGVLKIPSFILTTFDPQKNQYISHQIPSFSLLVKKGALEEESNQSFLEDETEHNKQSASLEPLYTFYWPSFIKHKILIKFWWILFSFFLTSLLFSYLKNLVFKKEKSIKEKIQKKFLNIQNLLDKKDWKKACLQMIHICDFILQTAQIQSSFSGWRQALNKLPPSLNKKYATQFENIFKELENLSFSVQVHSEKVALLKAKSLFQQTKTLVHSLLLDL